MFIFKIVTTRPNTTNLFFPETELGQTYESIMELAKAGRPKQGINCVIDVVRTLSPDELTLTTEYKFVSVNGKDGLLDSFAIQVGSQGLDPVYLARDAYNTTVGHSSTITFEKVDDIQEV